MKRAFPLLAFALFAVRLSVAEPPDVQRILAEHCLECHGPDEAKGGLTFLNRDAVLKELESGARAVVPGDLAKSELIQRILTDDPDDKMPPKKKKPLTGAEIAALKQWVASGAEWRVHWAYEPLVRPQPPAGAAHPIDAFVRAKLAEKKFQPSPEADRYTLIRRLSLDLLGLPPTPEEADAFIADQVPDAYEKLVDRLLASPHFGERWGRHWLDRARYADSDGYEKDNARPDAWRYRDWVIDAVNRDVPLDQFTVEQLAGDLLPNPTPEQKLATAFHRQTLTNTEGGTDKEQFRIEATFDRTETTAGIWLAHTFTCARCHTHKYDRLTQREYYQMFAFFNDTEETTAPIKISDQAVRDYEAAMKQHGAKLKDLEAKLAAVTRDLATRQAAWEKALAARLQTAKAGEPAEVAAKIVSVTATSKTTFKAQPDGSQLASGKVPPKDTYTVTLELPAQLVSGLKLEVLPDPSLPGKGPGRSKGGNFVLSEISVRAGTKVPLHSPHADHSQNNWPVEAALDGKPDTGWGIAPQIGKAHAATFYFARPIDGATTKRITVTLDQQYKNGEHSIGRFRLAALTGETLETIAPREVREVAEMVPGDRSEEQRQAIADYFATQDPAALQARDQLTAAQATAPKPPTMDVRVLTAKARETKVLHRGEFLSPTDPVEAGGPSILPPLKARAGGKPDRLDLAHWLMSAENPLTPRVLANQVWMILFGEGLVRTPGDFGVRGEKPTHPELLDWLATEWPRLGWSRKQFIRTIVTSATYRQRSEARPELAEKDPLNLLLARQNRVRVEGEIVRDLHLAASGLLSRKVGGPSVFPPMPPEVAAISYANNFKWNEATDENRYRRGMYTFFKRTAPYPDLITFDCPDANLTALKRSVSNTPLQALTTLNSRAFAEAAVAMAKRLLADADDAARLQHCFRLCVTRPATTGELATLGRLLDQSRAYYTAHPDEAKAAAGDAKAPVEVAALAATARIVMNLDEFITRE